MAGVIGLQHGGQSRVVLEIQSERLPEPVPPSFAPRHGVGDASNYMMRWRWDYFVQHLLGATPPPSYEIGKASL